MISKLQKRRASRKTESEPNPNPPYIQTPTQTFQLAPVNKDKARISQARVGVRLTAYDPNPSAAAERRRDGPPRRGGEDRAATPTLPPPVAALFFFLVYRRGLRRRIRPAFLHPPSPRSQGEGAGFRFAGLPSGADSELLHHCPCRSRQVDARGSAPRAHRHDQEGPRAAPVPRQAAGELLRARVLFW